MPGTRYSVFNPDGESFVPDQDRFNAQLQQMAMQNMTGLAGINERAREFNIGDQTNRWNAQAQYGLGNKQLDIGSHQFDSSQALARELAMANLGFQKDSLAAQMEAPRAQLAMQKEQWGEGAQSRALAQQLTQAQLQREQNSQKYMAGLVNQSGPIDPTKAALAGGGSIGDVLRIQQDQTNQQAQPFLGQADVDIRANTPASRKHLASVQGSLQGLGYKGVPQNTELNPTTFADWADQNQEFGKPLGDLTSRFGNYANNADTWFGDPNTTGDKEEILKDATRMRAAASKAGYDSSEVDAVLKQAALGQLARHRKAWYGSRTPYGSSNIDDLTNALKIGNLTGSDQPSGFDRKAAAVGQVTPFITPFL